MNIQLDLNSLLTQNTTIVVADDDGEENNIITQKRKLLARYSLPLIHSLPLDEPPNKEECLQKLINAARVCVMKDMELYFWDRCDAKKQEEEIGFINPRTEYQMFNAIRKFLLNEKAPLWIIQEIEAIPTKIFLPHNNHSAPQRLLMSMNQNPEKDADLSLSRFHSWLIENGASSRSFGIANFTNTGRGAIVASGTIQPFHPFIKIPQHLILCSNSATSDPKLGKIFKEIEGLDDETIFFLYVLHEKFNPDSFWKPMFDVLPLTFHTSLLMNVQDWLELEGTPLFDETLQAKEQLRFLHEMLFPKLTDHYPTYFPEDVFSFENFLWVRSLFDSRAIQLELGGKVTPCFIPLFDMINHSHYPQVFSKSYDENEKCFIAQTAYEVPCNDQLFLSYGALKNWELLLYYGFVIEDNEYDSFHIGFEIPDEDESIYQRKLNLLTCFGLSLSNFFAKNGISEKMIASLRVSLLAPEELDTVESVLKNNAYGVISPSNEKKAWKTLKDTINQLLDSFSTTLESDQNILSQISKGNKENEDGETFSEDFVLVLKYRIEQKKILVDSLSHVEKKLWEIDQQENQSSLKPISRNNIPTVSVGDAQIKWLVNKNLGATELTVGHTVMKVGGKNPLHIHPNCEEVLYLLHGEITHLIEDNEGKLQQHPMKTGDVAIVPRGKKHQAINTGKEEANWVVTFSSAQRETIYCDSDSSSS